MKIPALEDYTIVHSSDVYPVRCSHYLRQAQCQLWSQLEMLGPTYANKPCLSEALLAQAQPYTVGGLSLWGQNQLTPCQLAQVQGLHICSLYLHA